MTKKQGFKGGRYDPVNGFRPLEQVSAYPQPMPVQFSETDTPEQRVLKFHLNTNSIYGKFGGYLNLHTGPRTSARDFFPYKGDS